jgi:hypothetical protein
MNDEQKLKTCSGRSNRGARARIGSGKEMLGFRWAKDARNFVVFPASLVK